MNRQWKKACWDVVSKESLELWQDVANAMAEKYGNLNSMNQMLDESVDFSADSKLFFSWENVLKIA